MHISGKILLFFVIIGAAAATAFTARMIKVRNSWMKANQELRQQNEANAEVLATKTAELAALRDEMKVTLLDWGLPVVNVNPAQISATAVSLPIGTRNGILSGKQRQNADGTQGENPMLQVFRPAADGQGYEWIGPFYAQDVTETNSVLVPTWSARAPDVAQWSAANQAWRVWNRVPAGAVSRFTDLQQSLLTADEKLNYLNQTDLVKQQKLVEAAKQQNQARREELLGPPNPPEAPADPERMEYSHGLLAAIAAEEEARNAMLADIDRLRRDLKQAYATLNETLEKNAQRVKQLPQPATSPKPDEFSSR